MYNNGTKCTTPVYTEKELMEFSVKAFNLLITEKDEVLKNIKSCISEFCNTKALKKQQEELARELAIQVEIVQDLVAENARKPQSQEKYQAKYDKEAGIYEQLKAKYDSVEEQLQKTNARKSILDNFLRELKRLDGPITEFDEALFGLMVSEIIAKNDGKNSFTFLDGTQVNL